MTAIVGASATGKTTLLAKLVDWDTPCETRGDIMRDSNFAFATQQQEPFDRSHTVQKHLDYLAMLGKVNKNNVVHFMKKLGESDLLQSKMIHLQPK